MAFGEMAKLDEARAPSPRELKALIEAERTGLPFLHWHDGADTQRVLLLSTDRPRITIGRRAQSDVSLVWDAEVSRAHALLECMGGEWTLVDDGLSRNGSFVNGRRVHGRQRLHHRDRLCVGNTLMIFHGAGGALGSGSTTRAGEGSSAPHLTETQRRILIALCRPIAAASSPTPATNSQIAAEVSLSVDAVKAHLRVLFERFGLSELPQNEKRGRLVSSVLSTRVLAPRDF